MQQSTEAYCMTNNYVDESHESYQPAVLLILNLNNKQAALFMIFFFTREQNISRSTYSRGEVLLAFDKTKPEE
jgi:hypothetical protein